MKLLLKNNSGFVIDAVLLETVVFGECRKRRVKFKCYPDVCNQDLIKHASMYSTLSTWVLWSEKKRTHRCLSLELPIIKQGREKEAGWGKKKSLNNSIRKLEKHYNN